MQHRQYLSKLVKLQPCMDALPFSVLEYLIRAAAP